LSYVKQKISNKVGWIAFFSSLPMDKPSLWIKEELIIKKKNKEKDIYKLGDKLYNLSPPFS
jgi:hypothetical protein